MPVVVCGGCGVGRMDQATCPHCAAKGPWITVHDRDDGAAWVGLLCTFKCRACGFAVPLNHLDTDGAVTCARCGVEQVFVVDAWKDVLDLAHATADLAGARGASAWTLPDGHRSKRQRRDHEQSDLARAEHLFGALGKSRWHTETGPLGASELQVSVCPGAPLCTACRNPLATRETDAGSEVRCPHCNASGTYAVPAAARTMASALRTVVAPEHRTDRETVGVVEASGQSALAIVCPSCTAPLPMAAIRADKLVTCTHCHVVSRVPDRTWFRVSGKEPVSEPIWLLFAGASARRAALERARRIEEEALVARELHERHEAERRRHDKELSERRQAEETARAHEAAERAAQEHAQEAARARSEEAHRLAAEATETLRVEQARARTRMWLGAAVVVGMLIALLVTLARR